MGLRSWVRDCADEWMYDRERYGRKRVPLRASQHILHLLLTVFTLGLWAPVWLVRAWRGNPNPARYGR